MKKSSIIIFLTFILFLTFLTGCTIIEDGQVGVKKSFGKISDKSVKQGIILQIPIVRTIETWNIKTQRIEERAKVPSSEGLIVGLDTSILFRVKPGMAPQIRKTIGLTYREVLVIPYFRNAMRDVVSGAKVKNMYNEAGRKEIANKVLNSLQRNLGPKGIDVQDILLKDITLPERFKQSIENKLTAEQRAGQKQFEFEAQKKQKTYSIIRL